MDLVAQVGRTPTRRCLRIDGDPDHRDRRGHRNHRSGQRSSSRTTEAAAIREPLSLVAVDQDDPAKFVAAGDVSALNVGRAVVAVDGNEVVEWLVRMLAAVRADVWHTLFLLDVRDRAGCAISPMTPP